MTFFFFFTGAGANSWVSNVTPIQHQAGPRRGESIFSWVGDRDRQSTTFSLGVCAATRRMYDIVQSEGEDSRLSSGEKHELYWSFFFFFFFFLFL
jgi:hypothetical protein